MQVHLQKDFYKRHKVQKQPLTEAKAILGIFTQGFLQITESVRAGRWTRWTLNMKKHA